MTVCPRLYRPPKSSPSRCGPAGHGPCSHPHAPPVYSTSGSPCRRTRARVKVPAAARGVRSCGSIIGKGGSAIQALQKGSGCRMNLSKVRPARCAPWRSALRERIPISGRELGPPFGSTWCQPAYRRTRSTMLASCSSAAPGSRRAPAPWLLPRPRLPSPSHTRRPHHRPTPPLQPPRPRPTGPPATRVIFD
jgi:hypothetical protein